MIWMRHGTVRGGGAGVFGCWDGTGGPAGSSAADCGVWSWRCGAGGGCQRVDGLSLACTDGAARRPLDGRLRRIGAGHERQAERTAGGQPRPQGPALLLAADRYRGADLPSARRAVPPPRRSDSTGAWSSSTTRWPASTMRCHRRGWGRTPELRPRKHRQAQVDHRRVQRVFVVLELGTLVW